MMTFASPLLSIHSCSDFRQRSAAAFCAISFRRSGVIFFARFLPRLLPTLGGGACQLLALVRALRNWSAT
jgi:hypothetical protein